jgi:2-amino-4-hydroxy-6-hydroxymethyldihydropteridine pyrophosphokinase
MSIIYIGIGTNLGNKAKNLKQAINLLEKHVGKCHKISSFYASKPFGFDSENDFLNAVVEIETCILPFELLRETQEIEYEIGRTKKSVNGIYQDRIIDIDILLYDNEIIDTPELKIPHPHIAERDFVLIPLKEIAPETAKKFTAAHF